MSTTLALIAALSELIFNFSAARLRRAAEKLKIASAESRKKLPIKYILLFDVIK